jgi:iron complex outermembrane receptor protein
VETQAQAHTASPVAGLLLALWFSACGCVAQTAYEFDLQGQALSESLIQFSHQSGLAIVFSDNDIRGLVAPRVSGSLPADQALDRLLAGSGFSWRLIDNRIVAIYDPRCKSDATCLDDETLLVSQPLYVPGIEELYVYGNRVTGSRIRRDALEGSAPVDVISAPDIELTGAQTLGDILRFMPAVAGNATSTAINRGGDGTATVNLRGLPASSTLVLINGRRVANDGLAGESVDLNSISPAAVERIEVLKSGASAIYGSDAIAGVVNIIMKRDFYGLLVEQFGGISGEGDAETLTTTVQYGTGFTHGSLFFSATRFDQAEIAARDRDLSGTADSRLRGGADLRSSATPGARVTLPGGDTLIQDPNHGGFRPATAEDRFDFPAFTTSLVPSQRDSLYFSASYDFTDQVTGTLEAGYTETSARTRLAPTPLFTAFEQQPVRIAADNPFNPFGVPVDDLRRSLVELPARVQQNKSDVTRLSALFEGLSGDWSWEWALDWSRSNANESTTGVIDADNLRRGVGPAANCRGLEIDGCVPINLFGPPGSIDAQQVAYLSVPGKIRGESKLASSRVIAHTQLMELPQGPVEFVVGAEYRDESTEKKPDRRLASIGTIGGTNFAPTRGDRRVTELFFESVTPMWRSNSRGQQFDLELALRYSHYSDFGSSTNPKVGIRIQLTPSLMVRGTYAQGFRAPTLNELFQGQTERQAFITDPCAIPENVGRLPGCERLADPTRTEFLTLVGGNPDLQEEKAVSVGAGLVWTPADAPGLSLSIDYFDIDTDNAVDASAQFILNQNAALGRFDEQVERDAAGNLRLINATNLNVGRRRVQGLDLSLNYRLPTRDWGQWSAAFEFAYIDEYSIQLDEDAPTLDLAGRFVDPASEGVGGIPEWKSTLGLQWARQRWRGSYEMHFISEMEETVPNTTRTRLIDSWIVQDLQFSYVLNVLRGLRVSVGVDNLLDNNPPFAASAFNDNFDGRSHELRGRFWYAKLSQRL